jgi:hypothetical protein
VSGVHKAAQYVRLCERTMTINTPKLQYSAVCVLVPAPVKDMNALLRRQYHPGGLKAYPKHRSNYHYTIASRLSRARDESVSESSGGSPRISIYFTPAHRESSFGFKSSNVLSFLAAADTVAYRASRTAHLDDPKSHVLYSYRISNGHQQ